MRCPVVVASAFLLWLGLASPGWAAPTFPVGQQVEGFNSFSSSLVTATFGGATASGSVIAFCAFWDSVATPPTFTNAGGAVGTFTDSGLGIVNNAAIGFNAECGAFLAPATAVTSITANFSGTPPTFAGVYAWEIDGLVLPAHVDGKNVANNTGTSALNSGNTATLAEAVEPAISIAITGTNVLSLGSGWTGTISGVSGNAFQWQVTSTTSPIAGTATNNGTGGAQTWVMTLKDASTPSVGSGSIRTLMGVGK